MAGSSENNSQEAKNLVQEVGPVRGHALDKLGRICRSLVKIICYEWQRSTRMIKWVLTGLILTSGDNFCHVIALWNIVLSAQSSRWRFEVVFPDGTKMNLARSIKVQGMMAAFTLWTDAEVQPVQISQQKVSQNDKVFAVGFTLDLGRQNGSEAIISYISGGFVTHEGDASFNHDCPPCIETYDGGPIFNMQDELVGITFKDRGIAIAFSISSITNMLAAFHEGMAEKPLSVILQCIKDKAVSTAKQRENGRGSQRNKRKRTGKSKK